MNNYNHNNGWPSHKSCSFAHWRRPFLCLSLRKPIIISSLFGSYLWQVMSFQNWQRDGLTDKATQNPLCYVSYSTDGHINSCTKQQRLCACCPTLITNKICSLKGIFIYFVPIHIPHKLRERKLWTIWICSCQIVKCNSWGTIRNIGIPFRVYFWG